MNKPFVTNTSNELWGIDFIDMSTYRGIGVHNYRYIMTVVDYYSGRLFARATRNRENGANGANNTIADNFTNIVNTEAGGFYPHSVICDNEFPVAGFLALCRQNNIILRPSLSYSPSTTGKVENRNKSVRKLLSALFIRNNNLIWVPFLQDLVLNVNNQVSSVYPYSAMQIWTVGYVPPVGLPLANPPVLSDNTTPAQRQEIQRYSHLKRGKQIISSGRNIPILQVGDTVNVSMLLYSSLQRRARKNNVSSYNKVGLHYSPQPLVVTRVYRQPLNAVTRDQYELSNQQNVHIMNGIVRKRFFGNDLVKIETPIVASSVQPANVPRAEELNKLR